MSVICQRPVITREMVRSGARSQRSTAVSRFVLMSLPLAAIATVLIVGAFRAPVEFMQVLLGSGIVCGCLAIFTALLGFLSDSAIDAAQFDDLLVIEPRAGGMAR